MLKPMAAYVSGTIFPEDAAKAITEEMRRLLADWHARGDVGPNPLHQMTRNYVGHVLRRYAKAHDKQLRWPSSLPACCDIT
jgi:hypothetical protein